MSMVEGTKGDVVIGSGKYSYRVAEGWGKLPKGWSFSDVAAVAVDRDDNVYAFTRGEHPIIVLDRNGTFLGSWGEDIFTRAHGAHIGEDNLLYLTDDGDHTVRKCTLEGKVLLTLGIPNQPQPYMSQKPFNRCTHTALSPENDIYVSDGYGNAAIHKYSSGGKLLFSWGSPGMEPGQFNVPHNLCCDAQGFVYVADRESHRVQVFDGKGTFQGQWTNVHRPCGMCMDNGKDDPLFYIGEAGPVLAINRNTPNLGPRVSVLNKKGELLARVGDKEAAHEPGAFVAPHGMAVDSRGDIYVGECAVSAWSSIFPNVQKPEHIVTLQKLVKVG